MYVCDVPEMEIYSPRVDQVPDVEITHELWLLKPTKFILENTLFYDKNKSIKQIYDEIIQTLK